jgi:hypothetical protein
MGGPGCHRLARLTGLIGLTVVDGLVDLTGLAGLADLSRMGRGADLFCQGLLPDNSMYNPRGRVAVEKPRGRDERQQETGSSHIVCRQPAAGFFPEPFGQSLPAAFMVIETLFRKGIRLAETCAPG